MPAYRAVLANLSAPPDTSQLSRCDEAETAQAICSLTARLMRRRRSLENDERRLPVLQPLLGALRRLQNPHLRAYRHVPGTLLSEPFCAIPSVIRPVCSSVARQLIADMLAGAPPERLISALSAFGESALRKARDGGVRIVIVPDGRRLSQFSTAVAAVVPSIDDWAAPPNGLFVLQERLLLVRRHALRMTAAHEFAHALDAVLAKRTASYFSYESDELRARYGAATGFVNEYAASGLDEYFAEALRAYVEVNDERSCWLPLTRYELFMRDPALFASIENLFASLQ